MTDPLAPAPTVAPEWAPVPAPARKSNRSLNALLAVAAIIAVAGIAFAGGRLTAPTAAASNRTGFPGAGFPTRSFNPGGGGFGNRGAFGATSLRGSVTAISSDSITVQLETGNSITVPLDSSTTYHQATSSTASSVTVGSNVIVEPGQITVQPGASFAPGQGPGNFNFGPARDVTVVAN